MGEVQRICIRKRIKLGYRYLTGEVVMNRRKFLQLVGLSSLFGTGAVAAVPKDIGHVGLLSGDELEILSLKYRGSILGFRPTHIVCDERTYMKIKTKNRYNL